MVSECEVETLKTIYYASIYSHISYRIYIYSATNKNNLKHNDSVNIFLSGLEILKVYGLYIIEIIKFAFNNSD